MKTWIQTGTIQKGMASGQIGSSTLGPTEVEKFVNSGWIVSLGDSRLAVGWGEGQWQTSPPTHAIALYAPDFFLSREQPWWVSEHTSILRATELVDYLGVPDALKISKWQEPEVERFATVFNHLQSEFRVGRAQKAVPVVYSRAKSVGGRQVNRTLLANALKNIQGSQRLYGWWGPSEGLLGLTPEVLFSSTADGKIQTMALAGTRPGVLSAIEAEAFLADPKERAEHQWVIDDLRERLSSHGKVAVGETRVLQLPKLAHLYTPLSVQTREHVDFESFARVLHPTPALGVVPRALGFEWMRAWDEVEPRGRFGAPFGVKIESQLECLVAIRNVQWSGDDRERFWILGSGCGVIAQSVLETEWKELAAKRESVRHALGL